MKRKLPAPVLALMTLGLLIVFVVPLVGQHYQLTDGQRGFFTGLGVGMEVLALLAARRYKRTIQD